ncbi:fatty-acid-binding protein 1 isoform X1 [Quercus robur]|uniref:fatty-acid-binding protein 1 isoform X1 n=1 Tax=Quercus robur TaxID=38942 RepID=UPI0021639733|nr:fatty-acid-binding protein 1 isoform X1 [Quercus robur]
MVSLRFPFLFSQPPKPNPKLPHTKPTTTASTFLAASAVVATAGAAAIAICQDPKDPFLKKALNSLFSNKSNNCSLPLWGSLSLAENSSSSSTVVESKTGVSFPSVLDDSKRLLGIGLRKKSVLGLKNIDVYAFGVYADDNDLKKFLSEKYGKLSNTEFKENKEFNEYLIENDICMTVRLQIVYSKLSIRSVRSAFEESVGSRLQKFGGSDNKDLLQRFTSQFKDEYKIPRGSLIDLSREPGHVLCTKIDGKEVGSIQSQLLCQSILDLYIGKDPFDRQAKEDIEHNLASLLHK